MAITVGDQMRLEVLHPPRQPMTNTASDINNNSVVLRLRYGNFSLLLAEDVHEEAEESLLRSGQPLDGPPLKVPHHGGDTSLTEPFLDAVGPDLAIISVGADNRFGHPHQTTLEKLRRTPTCRTAQEGSVGVHSDGRHYWVTTES
jgi:competence protein ComEC